MIIGQHPNLSWGSNEKSFYKKNMILIQMTGLSGAGKSTIAQATHKRLTELGYKVELIDGDHYRQHLCHDLGFSKADRLENIRRLGFVGLTLARHGIISIMAAINPYEEARERLRQQSLMVKTVFVDCPLSTTTARDPKGLYRKALLPSNHPEHIGYFTGISDPFELPLNADLVLKTDIETIEESTELLIHFILENIGNQ
jgi:adenylylsulfate kinase